MKVIFIKDTRENPAHKQIESITSSYDYVDAYVFDDEIKYFGKLPFIRRYLYNLTEPDPNHLKNYLETCSKEDINNKEIDQHEALLTKYLALTCELDTMTKTMTPAQLFATNHPAWAKTYYPETIATLCAIVRTLSNMGYQNRADYADIVLNMVDDYQNDDYHYLQEFHSDAILEVKDRLGYPLLN